MQLTARFNIHKFYLLPTHCIYMFCVDLRTNSDYFSIQNHLTCLYSREGGVYCAVRTGSLNMIQAGFRLQNVKRAVPA